MSAPFIPDAGTFFYVKLKPRQQVIEMAFGPAQVVERQDGSYSTEVWQCTARDDRAIVARCASYKRDPLLLLQDECNFYPVGPEVLSALGINTSEKA